jgi:hypothetical protein
MLKRKLREMNTHSVAYLDTVEAFFRYVPKGLRTILEPTHGRRVRVEPCADKYGMVWGYRVILHQPNDSTLETLDRLQKEHGGKLCRLDVAYDFSSHSRDWLDRHSTMRWRRRGPMLDEENGVYFIQQKDRRRRSGRDIAFYWDRPSKITGELDIPHLELRLQNTETVRREGFKHAGDLIGLNPKDLFQRHIKLVEVDIEGIKWSIIRKTLRDERLSYIAKRPRKVSSWFDRYRASLPHRLARQFDRIVQGRAQVIKDLLPNAIQRGKIIPVDVLGIPNRLDWVPLISKKNFVKTEDIGV